jgi:hypothetical protein
MAKTSLTEKGKTFIRNACNGTGNSLLVGNNGPLPYSNPIINKSWISNPNINGNIKTNQQLGEALINWFNEFGGLYQLDPNIIAAQAYQESAYKVWNYVSINNNPVSTAGGISQFIMGTVYDQIFNVNKNFFSQSEKDALTIGFLTNPNLPSSFDTSIDGQKNRQFLQQNICDNPKIMIKAQFVYMKYISDNFTKGTASSTLFGYSRGQSLCTPSYSTSIQNASKHKAGSELEGVNYVLSIFKFLYNNFGYDDLGMKLPFDTWKAQTAETNLRTLK